MLNKLSHIICSPVRNFIAPSIAIIGCYQVGQSFLPLCLSMSASMGTAILPTTTKVISFCLFPLLPILHIANPIVGLMLTICLAHQAIHFAKHTYDFIQDCSKSGISKASHNAYEKLPEMRPIISAASDVGYQALGSLRSTAAWACKEGIQYCSKQM